MSDSLLVHLRDHPVSYYFALDMPEMSPMNPTNKVFPIYERYFDSPVRVADSFYVGVTQQSYDPDYIYIDSTDYWEVEDDTHRKVMLSSIYPGNDTNLFSERVVHKVFWRGRIQYFYDTSYHVHFYALMFPIVVPPYSDTTGVDTTIVDTTGIVSPQLLERYINVVPNPATDKVQVLSSFGLREVEVYDAAGTRVLLRRRLTGYTADLDVSALPAGAYLVRVTTPGGTVTKKLIVQRR